MVDDGAGRMATGASVVAGETSSVLDTRRSQVFNSSRRRLDNTSSGSIARNVCVSLFKSMNWVAVNEVRVRTCADVQRISVGSNQFIAIQSISLPRPG